MDHLNFHHLRLFWMVAREGGLTAASRRLHLTPQTISGQIRAFETAIGEKLFVRSGRRLRLTELGRVVARYAEEIFALGRELEEVVRGGCGRGDVVQLAVGVVDVVPKQVAYRLLAPALRLEQPVRVSSREGNLEALLADLAIHHLDLVISDRPIPPGMHVRAYNHVLGECGVSFLAAPTLARRLRAGFPRALDGEPALLARKETTLRRELDAWFAEHGITPQVAGEFDDSALLKVFGQAGHGFFAVPAVIEQEVCQQYEVEPIARVEAIVERFFAISVERRIRHPAIAAICRLARTEVFGGE